MTYCDPSVLAPYCTATYCEACSKARYENERKNSTELPRKVVTKNQHEKIMQQQGTSKYNKV